MSGLTAATFGNSDDVQVGDEVIAIGSPGGLQGTVTTGIVSALDRKVTVSTEEEVAEPVPVQRRTAAGRASTTTYQALQTDAAINQGNSGGPLFNSAGPGDRHQLGHVLAGDRAERLSGQRRHRVRHPEQPGPAGGRQAVSHRP